MRVKALLGNASPAQRAALLRWGKSSDYGLTAVLVVSPSNPPDPLLLQGTGLGYEIIWHTPLACGRQVRQMLLGPLVQLNVCTGAR